MASKVGDSTRQEVTSPAMSHVVYIQQAKLCVSFTHKLSLALSPAGATLLPQGQPPRCPNGLAMFTHNHLILWLVCWALLLVWSTITFQKFSLNIHFLRVHKTLQCSC